MTKRTNFPFVQIEEPTDTRLYYAQSALDRLEGWPESVVCMIDPDHNYDHLLDLQHWYSKSYFLSDNSVLERESGEYRGVILYRPSDVQDRL